MIQTKISLEDKQNTFLNNYKLFGFKNRSSMIRVAINRLKEEFELEQLRKSADIYSEVYSEEKELRELTESALSGWPE